MCVCVCVCARAREQERARKREREREREREAERGGAHKRREAMRGLQPVCRDESEIKIEINLPNPWHSCHQLLRRRRP